MVHANLPQKKPESRMRYVLFYLAIWMLVCGVLISEFWEMGAM